jgi:hypothetical protein
MGRENDCTEYLEEKTVVIYLAVLSCCYHKNLGIRRNNSRYPVSQLEACTPLI